MIQLVESDPSVGRALGGGVDVSLVSTGILRRNVFRRDGIDRVNVVTTVDGSNHDATLWIDAENVAGHGWTGAFSVDAEGLTVMRDGHSTTENGGTLVHGTFAADGSLILAP